MAMTTIDVSSAPYVKPKQTGVIPPRRVVIVDVDGTVALMNGRSLYDENTVLDDKPNVPVIGVVRALVVAAGLHPVFMSGRTEACRTTTVAWLHAHVLRCLGVRLELYMRPVGDFRPDNELKLDLFNTHVRNRYDVQLVLDDRDKVVALWRSLGLTCLQVAPGDF